MCAALSSPSLVCVSMELIRGDVGVRWLMIVTIGGLEQDDVDAGLISPSRSFGEAAK